MNNQTIPQEIVQSLLNNSQKLSSFIEKRLTSIAECVLNYNEKIDFSSISNDILLKILKATCNICKGDFRRYVEKFELLISSIVGRRTLYKELLNTSEFLKANWAALIAKHFSDINNVIITAFTIDFFGTEYLTRSFIPNLLISFENESSIVLKKFLDLIGLLERGIAKAIITHQNWTQIFEDTSNYRLVLDWLLEIKKMRLELAKKQTTTEEESTVVIRAQILANALPWKSILNEHSSITLLNDFFDTIDFLDKVESITKLDWGVILRASFSEDIEETLIMIRTHFSTISKYFHLSYAEIEDIVQFLIKKGRFDYLFFFLDYCLLAVCGLGKINFIYHNLSGSEILTPENLENTLKTAYNYEFKAFLKFLKKNDLIVHKRFANLYEERTLQSFNSNFIEVLIDIFESLKIELSDNDKTVLMKEPQWRKTDFLSFKNQSISKILLLPPEFLKFELVTLEDFVLLLRKEKKQLSDIDLLRKSITEQKSLWKNLIAIQNISTNDLRFGNEITAGILQLNQFLPNFSLHYYFIWFYNLIILFQEIDPSNEIKALFLKKCFDMDHIKSLITSGVLDQIDFRMHYEWIDVVKKIAENKLQKYQVFDSQFDGLISRNFNFIFLFNLLYNYIPDRINSIDYSKLKISVSNEIYNSLDLITGEANLVHETKTSLVISIAKLLKGDLITPTSFPFFIAKTHLNMKGKAFDYDLSKQGYTQLIQFIQKLGFEDLFQLLIQEIDWRFEFQRSIFDTSTLTQFLGLIIDNRELNKSLEELFIRVLPDLSEPLIKDILSQKNPIKVISDLLIRLMKYRLGVVSDSSYIKTFFEWFFSDTVFLSKRELIDLFTTDSYNENLLIIAHNFSHVEPKKADDLFQKYNFYEKLMNLIYLDFKRFEKVFTPNDIECFKTPLSRQIIASWDWAKVKWNISDFDMNNLGSLYFILEEFPETITGFLSSALIENFKVSLKNKNPVHFDFPLIIFARKFPELTEFHIELASLLDWKSFTEKALIEKSYALSSLLQDLQKNEQISYAIVHSKSFINIEWRYIIENYRFSLIELFENMAQLEELCPGTIYDNNSFLMVDWCSRFYSYLTVPYEHEVFITLLKLFSKPSKTEKISLLIDNCKLEDLDWSFLIKSTPKKSAKKDFISDLMNLVEAVKPGLSSLIANELVKNKRQEVSK